MIDNSKQNTIEHNQKVDNYIYLIFIYYVFKHFFPYSKTITGMTGNRDLFSQNKELVTRKQKEI